MFIRKKKSAASDKRTVEIVKNERFGDKVRQVIVAYIGVIRRSEDEENIMALAKIKLIELIKEESAQKNTPLSDEEAIQLSKRGRKKKALLPKDRMEQEIIPAILDNLKEEYRLVDGLNDIAGKAFDSLNLSDLLRSKKQNELFKNVILARIGFTESKHKLCTTMRRKMDLQYTEDQVYRLMDNLYPRIDTIKQKIFQHTHSLMPSVHVLLFDVTTLYFESTTQDELRNFGFGKDGKINNTQLVLALATNDRGLPIGYEVFSGNCAEVHTLFVAIQKWHRFLPIQKICFIGDRAMCSDDNLKLMDEHGYDYIIAAKLRSLSVELQEKILDEDFYQEVTFSNEIGRIAEFDVTPLLTKIRCELDTQALGYTAITKNQQITSLHYLSPCGIQKQMDNNAFLEEQEGIQKLKRYSNSTPCILMTQEEYSLKSGSQQNDVAIFRYGSEIVLASPPEALHPGIVFIYPNQAHTAINYSTVTEHGEMISDHELKLTPELTHHFVAEFNKGNKYHLSFEDRQAIFSYIETQKHAAADSLIYKKKVVTLSSLDPHQQAKLFKKVEHEAIPATLMRAMFKDLFIEKKHIYIPETIIAKIFPEHRVVKRRLCVSYKPSRAENDSYKRQKILSRLSAKEGTVNRVVKTAAKLYMSTTGNAILDQSKITAAEKWDGVHGVITNIQHEEPQNVIMRYTQLWRIEESFRINKHQLAMRPIYHYKPERIHTHLAICYIAFAILRLIEYQTELTQTHLSVDRILDALLSVESSIYYDHSTQRRYKMPGHMSDDAKIVYKSFGIKRQENPSFYFH